MEKKLLSTVLLYSLAEVLEGLIQKKKTESCAGCHIDHPSQHRHECLMNGEQEHLDRHFESVYASFTLLEVMNKFKEDVKKLNIPQDLICNYFILNVIMLDKLRTQTVKDNVYSLMKKRIRA